MSMMSSVMDSATPGRRTFTATVVPSRRAALCTWAMEAAPKGFGSMEIIHIMREYHGLRGLTPERAVEVLQALGPTYVKIVEEGGPVHLGDGGGP